MAKRSIPLQQTQQEPLDEAEVSQDQEENGATQEDEPESDEPKLVRLGHGEGHQHINGHPLKDGTVVAMKPADIDVHRSQGVPLLDVEDGYDGDVYDVSEPYAPPQDEEEVDAEQDE